MIYSRWAWCGRTYNIEISESQDSHSDVDFWRLSETAINMAIIQIDSKVINVQYCIVNIYVLWLRRRQRLLHCALYASTDFLAILNATHCDRLRIDMKSACLLCRP